jgi:hypothetical protein
LGWIRSDRDRERNRKKSAKDGMYVANNRAQGILPPLLSFVFLFGSYFCKSCNNYEEEGMEIQMNCSKTNMKKYRLQSCLKWIEHCLRAPTNCF